MFITIATKTIISQISFNTESGSIVGVSSNFSINFAYIALEIEDYIL